ncbi:hypothetical protein F441_12954 [Phytophthora nicotianae CJ01A1]|uniref:FZ domain-containing protein n=1 Tax=Phytophthora nicotianae CJ01A1 TaxID=1317063 RepID=W2WME2_PHYNI|nr:hypothetical protein F441_12954 [Phytophthora nicotianae CJ01A1]
MQPTCWLPLPASIKASAPSNPCSDAAITHPSIPTTAEDDVERALQYGCRRRHCRLGQHAALLTIFIVVALSSRCVSAAAVGTFQPQHCVKCAGLKYCTIMNGQYMFDPIAGYSRESTTQLEKQGVCEDLDAKTLALSPFGTQLQFKDTLACHKLVWNFHCLSWVTTTFQRNVNGTRVSCATTSGSTMVPLPPCRSLCVEVADKCVYSHFYRMYLDEVCGNIACLTETQEAKNTGSTDTNVAETTCVSGSWVYSENKTFSRCSTRAYEPPVAVATRDTICKAVIAVCVLSVLWLM